MTRELKLGLIVGFSVLLLVGILISDHLSQAHRDKVAGVLPDEASAVLPRERPELLDPVVADASPTPSSTTMPASNPGATGPTNATTGSIVAPPGDNPHDAPDSPTAPLPDPAGSSLAGTPVGVPVGGPGASGAGMTPAEIASAQGAGTPAGPTVSGNDQYIVINQGAPAGAGSAPATIAATPQQPPQTPSEMPAPAKTHVVKQGETLYKIAASHYGSGNSWRRIADANPGKIGPNGTVRQGVTLVIPEPPARKPVATPSAIAKKPDEKPAAKPASKSGTARLASYTVKKGDTLGDISKSVLGTSKRWREILALNQDEIDDEDDIRIGMVLKVPAG